MIGGGIKMANVYAISRKMAQLMHFTDNDYIISITNPDSDDADVNAKNILRLKFYDIDREIKTLDGHTFYPMSVEDADKIVEFIRSVSEMTENIYVHCEAGISRSTGVAAAISEYLSLPSEKFFRQGVPNRHCYGLLLKRFSCGGENE